MLEPNEVKDVRILFQQIKNVADDGVQLICMAYEMTDSRKQSLKNKAETMRKQLAELDDALKKL